MEEDFELWERESNAQTELDIMKSMMGMVWRKHCYDDRWKRMPLHALINEVTEEYRELIEQGGTDPHECISLALNSMMMAMRIMRGEEK